MPQGSVLSSVLFYIVINDILSTTPALGGFLNTHSTLTIMHYGTPHLTQFSAGRIEVPLDFFKFWASPLFHPVLGLSVVI